MMIRRAHHLKAMRPRAAALSRTASTSSRCVIQRPEQKARIKPSQKEVEGIWHGSQDANASVRKILHMAKFLLHSVFHEFAGDTHYTIYKYLQQIWKRSTIVSILRYCVSLIPPLERILYL